MILDPDGLPVATSSLTAGSDRFGDHQAWNMFGLVHLANLPSSDGDGTHPLRAAEGGKTAEPEMRCGAGTTDMYPFLAAVTVAVLVLGLGPLVAGPIAPDQITVTDGDTIRVSGEPVRLVGFNAPETSNARCDLERELGDRATVRLKALVTGGRLDFVIVACACRAGTEGTANCNYGRSCGTLRVEGRDLGDILVAEGLAVPFVCGATRCPATPRPWCE